MTEEDVPALSREIPSIAPARTPEMALAHWTERIAALSDLVASRELAGLSDEETERVGPGVSRTPRRKRTDVLRHAYAASALLALTGGGLALIEATTPGQAVQLSPLIQGAGVCFVSAFIAACAGAMSSLRLVPTEAAYAKLGFTWGCSTNSTPGCTKGLRGSPQPCRAQLPRQVLRERGPIRGMDYVMMCEIAEISREDGTHPERTGVASAVQGTSEGARPPGRASCRSGGAATGHVQAPALTAAPGTVLTLGGSTEAA